MPLARLPRSVLCTQAYHLQLIINPQKGQCPNQCCLCKYGQELAKKRKFKQVADHFVIFVQGLYDYELIFQVFKG